MFYASSWLLTHYLFNRQSELLQAFQQDLALLRDWRTAWDYRFVHLDSVALDNAVVEYARRGKQRSVRAQLSIAKTPIRVRPLSPGETHAARAWFAFRVGNPERAGQEHARAVALDAAPLDTLRLSFEQALEGDVSKAREIALRASREYPNQGASWRMLARVATAAEEQARALNKAASLAPNHPGVRRMQLLGALRKAETEEAADHAQLLLRRASPSLNLLELARAAMAGAGYVDAACRLTQTGLARADRDCQLTPAGGSQVVGCEEHFSGFLWSDCRGAAL